MQTDISLLFFRRRPPLAIHHLPLGRETNGIISLLNPTRLIANPLAHRAISKWTQSHTSLLHIGAIVIIQKTITINTTQSHLLSIAFPLTINRRPQHSSDMAPFLDQVSDLLQKRFSCPSGSYYDSYYNRCVAGSTWYWYGRWIFAAVVIVLFFLIFFLWA